MEQKSQGLQYIEKGEGEPLLFIHGWGVTQASYRDTITLLSKKFRVIAPYVRTGGNIKKSVTHLRELLQTLGIQKSIVMGHSSGGVVALTFAYEFSKETTAVILIDTMGLNSFHDEKKWFQIWVHHVMGLFKPKKDHSMHFLFFLASDFLSQIILHPKTLYKEARHALRENIAAMLEQLTVPVLVLWGKQDDLTPLSDAYKAKAINPHVVLKIFEGEHDWIKGNEEHFLATVTEFLEKNCYN